MSNHGNLAVLNLEECSEFYRTHRAPVPLRIHAACVLLSVLIVVAIGWSVWTQANVIIRGTGRMRPVANEHGVESASEQVSTEVAGRVAVVYVREDERVQRGQLLLEINTDQLDHQIATAEAEIVAIEAGIEQMTERHGLLGIEFEATQKRAQAEIEEAHSQMQRERARREAKIIAADAELIVEQAKVRRLSELLQRKIVSAQEFSEAQAALARAELAVSETQLTVDEHRPKVMEQTLQALIESHNTKLHESLNTMQEKRNELERKRLQLIGFQRDRQRCTIVSPVDGIVTNCRVSTSDFVQPGVISLTIVPTRDLEMVMSVKAADVGQLRLDMPVRIKMDAFDYQTYGTLDGSLRFISPDSTVSKEEPQQPASYTLRVKIPLQTLHRDGESLAMKLGMTGMGEVIVERNSLLSLLLRKVRHVISL